MWSLKISHWIVLTLLLTMGDGDRPAGTGEGRGKRQPLWHCDAAFGYKPPARWVRRRILFASGERLGRVTKTREKEGAGYCFSLSLFFLWSSTQLQHLEIQRSFFTLRWFLICKFNGNIVLSFLCLKIPKCLPLDTGLILYLVGIIKFLIIRSLPSSPAFYDFHTGVRFGNSHS